MHETTWEGPTLEQVRAAQLALQNRTFITPTVPLRSARIERYLPERSDVFVKLELLQQSGSFKSRGALLSMDSLSPSEREAGVVTASAGNHALALSWAANMQGVQATVVMPETADPARVRECVDLGADVVRASGIGAVFKRMLEIQDERSLTVIHPYENPNMTLGAATCGLEFHEHCTDMDVVVVPIGGGGLIGGIASISKQLNASKIIGVEPVGAALLTKSLAASKPIELETVSTIADSLGAPVSLPMSYGLIERHVDEIVCVTDDEMTKACAMFFDACKLSVEPACAAALAAICGPLRQSLAGKRIGLVACGTNISPKAAADLVESGKSLLAKEAA